MQVNSTLNPSEAEHAELNAVMKAFSDSPRLAKLLGYIGEKYFLGEIDQINEYNIATEVFGRSKVAFSASEDAIVRVEAYRLRRALKEFYKSDGKDHQVQICVPFGGYVPVFTRQSAELPLSALGDIPGPPADDNVVQVALEKDQPETWNLDRPRRHFFPAMPLLGFTWFPMAESARGVPRLCRVQCSQRFRRGLALSLLLLYLFTSCPATVEALKRIVRGLSGEQIVIFREANHGADCKPFFPIRMPPSFFNSSGPVSSPMTFLSSPVFTNCTCFSSHPIITKISPPST